MSQHGHCPNCGVDFDGGDILQTFLDKGYPPEKARKTANMYGYDKGRTQWGRQIGIEKEGDDWISSWRCPDCNHEWAR